MRRQENSLREQPHNHFLQKRISTQPYHFSNLVRHTGN